MLFGARDEGIVPLRPGTTSLGRDTKKSLSLDAPSVSWAHARIVGDGNQWKIIDTDSRNGTYVNGERVTVAALENRDEIQLGEVRLYFLDLP